jgi:hypothetical protein
MTLTFAYLLTVLSLAGGESTFVQADLVRLRYEPTTEAGVKGVVRLNTELKVETVEGDWAKVTHAPSATTGWTLTRFLGPKTVELSALQAQAEAPDAKPEERVSTLERWLALEPNRPELYSRLAQAYRDAGKPERAAHLERRLKGQAPTMLGVCFGEPTSSTTAHRLVTLVASYSRGALRPWSINAQVPEGSSTPREAHEAPEADPLWKLAYELPSLFWGRAGEEGLPPGTPFPSPSVELRQSYSPEVPSVYEIDLGTQDCKPGDLWASAPFASATLTPKQQAALKAFDAAHPLRSTDGRNVKLHISSSGPWIQPLFSDGSVLSVRNLYGGKDPMNYFGMELMHISPKNKVQRRVVMLYGQLE